MRKEPLIPDADQTLDSLAASARRWSAADWEQKPPCLGPLQIAEITPLANGQRLIALFHALKEKTQLEALGSALDGKQFLEILHEPGTSKQPHAEKLSNLLVSLSPKSFRCAIQNCPIESVHRLKKEVFGEPLLHQLSLLVKELGHECDLLTDDAIQEIARIEKLVLIELSLEQTNDLYQTLETMESHLQSRISAIQNAQRLAWNSDRPDLIEELTRVKERALRCSSDIIGKSGSAAPHAFPTVHSTLQGKIDVLFSDIDDQGGATKMDDALPAIEAIVKFSVWYLSDYEQLGILPKGSVKGLDATRNESDRLQVRKALYDLAGSNLARAGLTTLHDLKQKRLFSRRALEEYLSALHH